jgi:hypothetical protein
MTARVDDYCHACWSRCPTYPGDKRFCLCSWFTDADGFGLAGSSQGANINIVAPCGEIKASVAANSDVVVAGFVVKERLATGGIDTERLISNLLTPGFRQN